MTSLPLKSDGTRKTICVTCALPYANGDIHLGHIVEAAQTDIYVRYQKMLGNRVLFVCADDTHGTPIQLNALKKGITPEQLVEEVWQRHVKDYAGFSIGFDIFYTTNSPENKRYAELIYSKLREQGLIEDREIMQYYCENDKRFLPDRFIVGTCPTCGAENQYGDVCETCGSTYDPTDLKSPVCIICKKTPVLRPSTHMFVRLEKCEQFLRDFVIGSNVLHQEMKNFVKTWIDQGLRQWCISRDGPYFGFPIPGTENKYFYVWLDAPIGYLSSTDKWCADHGENVETFWGKQSPGELVHFIGKDIVYFHALFWPVMLNSAGFKLPTKIFVHGFLTVAGEKMSKSRGTFILASDYLSAIAHPQAPEYLRFYFGAKLSSHAADIDLNAEEFCNRVNTTLVNNIGNLHHRTFIFCDRNFNSMVPDAPWDESIAQAVAEAGNAIAQDYGETEYKSAIERIHALGNMGNKYYQDSKPWEMMKTDTAAAAKVMVTCLNLIKALAVFLKPVVPAIAKNLEEQLGVELKWNDYIFSLRNSKLGATKKIVTPIELAKFEKLFTSAVPSQSPAAPSAATPEVVAPVAATSAASAISAKEEKTGNQIEYATFQQVDLQTATILAAEKVEKSDKLIKLKVQVGSQTRQIVAGIAKFYTPESLIGRQIVVVANLKPAKLMGQTSEGMLLAAKDGDTLALLQPDKPVNSGVRVS
jgi:methionyl-tRNA synthetase